MVISGLKVINLPKIPDVLIRNTERFRKIRCFEIFKLRSLLEKILQAVPNVFQYYSLTFGIWVLPIWEI